MRQFGAKSQQLINSFYSLIDLLDKRDRGRDRDRETEIDIEIDIQIRTERETRILAPKTPKTCDLCHPVCNNVMYCQICGFNSPRFECRT